MVYLHCGQVSQLPRCILPKSKSGSLRVSVISCLKTAILSSFASHFCNIASNLCVKPFTWLCISSNLKRSCVPANRNGVGSNCFWSNSSSFDRIIFCLEAIVLLVFQIVFLSKYARIPNRNTCSYYELPWWPNVPFSKKGTETGPTSWKPGGKQRDLLLPFRADRALESHMEIVFPKMEA